MFHGVGVHTNILILRRIHNQTAQLNPNRSPCFTGTREVAKPKPKNPEGQDPLLAQLKPKQNESFVHSLIDRQLEEDSICGKIGKFFRQVSLELIRGASLPNAVAAVTTDAVHLI